MEKRVRSLWLDSYQILKIKLNTYSVTRFVLKKIKYKTNKNFVLRVDTNLPRH